MIKFTLILLFSFSLCAESQHSHMIDYIQEKYASEFADYPVLIFDIDKVEERFYKSDALGKDDESEKKRAKIIINYVFDEIGVELSLVQAISIESYTSLLKKSAYAVPIKKKLGSKDISMCAVFPASPNSNQNLEYDRLVSYQTAPENYKGADQNHFKEKMSFDELKHYSLFHEVAHCMDRSFFSEVLNAYEPTGHDVHLSESFAETMALMFMEHEGLKGTARKRLLLRNIVTKKMGNWFFENRHLAFGDKLFEDAGAIYWLVPSLVAAENYVEENSGRLSFLSFDEMQDISKEIVQKHAFEYRSFRAMSKYHATKEKAVEEYFDLAKKSPSFFKKAYEDLLSYIGLSKTFEKELIHTEPLTSFDQLKPVKKLDKAKLCHLYQKSNKEVFWNELQKQRNYLKSLSEAFSKEGQTQFQKDLNNLFYDLIKLDSSCDIVK